MNIRRFLLITLLSSAVFLPSLRAATAPDAGLYNVADYGAAGDGKTDCTAAFQKALDAAGSAGGGSVTVPAGRFFFKGTLVLPENVTLEGIWRAPVRGLPRGAGTELLVTAGKGDEDGEAFLRMSSSAVLKGVTIFYPEQIIANPPHPYPWTVQSNGFTDNITILDVTMVNPYKAVDLGTWPAGRHYVNRLYGYPLYRGIYINQCYDVGRIENIHFWPFWDIDPESPLWDFTREKAIAFILGKTDGEMGHNLFSIFYSIGMQFIAGPIYDEDRNITGHAAGCGMYTNCYMDVSPCAIRVDEVMDTAGVCFTNASIMSKVVVGQKNRGPVKFVNSGFWATRDLDSHALLEGRGTVIFQACQFNGWDRAEKGAPCISAGNRRLIVTGCDFPVTREDQQLIAIGPRVRSAIITSNLMPGGKHIINNAPENADIQIALNATEPPANYIKKWLVLGPFPNETTENKPENGVSRAGFDRDYLKSIGGESEAVITPETTVDWEGTSGRIWKADTGVVKTDEEHRVDMYRRFRDRQQAAYAFAWIQSGKEQTAFFDLGMNDGGKVFINGELAYQRFSAAGQPCVPGYDIFEHPLKKGWNRVLVKLEDGGGSKWRFIFEVCGEDGKPLKSSLAGK
jgi:hypothetical protein